MTKMTGTTVYEFTAAEGTSNDRFVLHFKEPKTEVPTDVDDLDGDENLVKVTIQNNTILTVSCPWQGEKQVLLYTVDGRLIDNSEFQNELFTKMVSLQPGIYIVKVIGDSNEYEQKVFVN
jgi:hypothetical protein